MITILEDGFENGFPSYNGIGELMTASKWTPVWLHDPDSPTVLNRPEFKPAGAPQILEGIGAQAIHSQFSTIDGAIARTIPVEPGVVHQAAVSCMGITGGGQQPFMGMVLEVCFEDKIDYANRIVDASSKWWSQDASDWNGGLWRTIFTPEFTPIGKNITVYLRFVTRFAVPANAHFDNFKLAAEEGTAPPPQGDLAKRVLEVAQRLELETAELKAIASQFGGGNQSALALIEEAEIKLAEAKAAL